MGATLSGAGQSRKTQGPPESRGGCERAPFLGAATERNPHVAATTVVVTIFLLQVPRAADTCQALTCARCLAGINPLDPYPNSVTRYCCYPHLQVEKLRCGAVKNSPRVMHLVSSRGGTGDPARALWRSPLPCTTAATPNPEEAVQKGGAGGPGAPLLRFLLAPALALQADAEKKLGPSARPKGLGGQAGGTLTHSFPS